MTATVLFQSIKALYDEIESTVDDAGYSTGIKGVSYDAIRTSKTNKYSDTVYNATIDNLSKEKRIAGLWGRYNQLLQVKSYVLTAIEKQNDDGILLSCILRMVVSGKSISVICKDLKISRKQYQTMYDDAMQAADRILSANCNCTLEKA